MWQCCRSRKIIICCNDSNINDTDSRDISNTIRCSRGRNWNGCSPILQSHPYNTTLEELAFRSGPNIQNTLFSDELIRHMSSQSNTSTWKDTNVPLQICQILLVPTWEGGLRLPSTSSSVSDPQHWNNMSKDYDLIRCLWQSNRRTCLKRRRPTTNLIGHLQFMQAKYSKLFCHRYAKYYFDFELKYKAIHTPRTMYVIRTFVDMERERFVSGEMAEISKAHRREYESTILFSMQTS